MAMLGAKIAISATTPPSRPPTRKPTKAAVLRNGPGVAWPKAIPTPNSWGLSQWWLVTTSCWRIGRIVDPFPNATLPIVAIDDTRSRTVPPARMAAPTPAPTRAAGTNATANRDRENETSSDEPVALCGAGPQGDDSDEQP